MYIYYIYIHKTYENVEDYSKGAQIFRNKFNLSIVELKNRKAPGIDKILSELLQKVSEKLLDSYYILHY